MTPGDDVMQEGDDRYDVSGNQKQREEPQHGHAHNARGDGGLPVVWCRRLASYCGRQLVPGHVQFSPQPLQRGSQRLAVADVSRSFSVRACAGAHFVDLGLS